MEKKVNGQFKIYTLYCYFNACQVPKFQNKIRHKEQKWMTGIIIISEVRNTSFS